MPLSEQSISARLPPRVSPSERWRGSLIAAGVFAAALAFTFVDVWNTGGGSTHTPCSENLIGGRFDASTRADLKYEMWLVARHARVLVEQPTALFDTEHCAPYPDTLTFGIPMVTMGILGIPAMLATDDPVWTLSLIHI